MSTAARPIGYDETPSNATVLVDSQLDARSPVPTLMQPDWLVHRLTLQLAPRLGEDAPRGQHSPQQTLDN
jgi:hypothetical protein